MTKSTAAVVAIVLIIAISTVGLGLIISQGQSSFQTTSSSSTSSQSTGSQTNSETSESSSASAPARIYQVLETNLTLTGQAATVPCTGMNEGCPSATNASVSQVELIRYGPSVFYVYNQSAPTGAPQSDEQPIEPYVNYTIWFTNSTVYCISPAHALTNTEHQNRTCPAQPYASLTVTIPAAVASAVDPTTGLRASLNLSADQDGALTVDVEEFNTLASANNLSVGNDWPSGSVRGLFLWSQGWCGQPFLPIGYEILQGNYGQGNFTEGTPLVLDAQPTMLGCPAETPTPYFYFGPLSDVAETYEYGNIPNLAGIYNVTIDSLASFSGGPWSGAWTGSAWQAGAGSIGGGDCPGSTSTSGCPLELNPFAPGAYTVVAGDEWGQVLILHFMVEG
jgi:hypothetical protein